MTWLLLLMLLAPQDDSPLVKAAKAAGGPRKPSAKVITNDDVKKAAAKSASLPPAASAPPSDAKTPLEKLAEQKHARFDAVTRLETAEKHAAELEAELRRLEQAYYEEFDLNRRDTVLVPKYEATKKELEDAKRELAAARDALK